jgi:hypothetical protein
MSAAVEVGIVFYVAVTWSCGQLHHVRADSTGCRQLHTDGIVH